MELEVIVSGGNAVRVFSLNSAQEKLHMPLEQAGALCVSGNRLFCACGDAIWALERQSLTPQALFGGGPGVCQLMTSPDGLRLYALCSEADSVLMLDSRAGQPLLVNNAGVNPRQMTLNGDVLAIAGGESGYVFLLCAQSLRMLNALSMPGPVYSAALCGGNVYALCLTPSLSSVLVTQSRNGLRRELSLVGMPGRLHVGHGVLMAATEGMVCTVSQDGSRILRRQSAPGRASWLHEARGKLLLLDDYTDRLLGKGQKGWRMICAGACAAAVDGA